jgi:hypothetical protein
MSLTLGAAIASCDEGDLLSDCLPSVSGFDEVVVFDLESTDETVAIARAHGADVVSLGRPPYVELIRSEQLARMTTDWVLFVDPDERVPRGWLDVTRRLVTEAPPDVSAFWIGYREIAFGTPLMHTRLGAAKIALVRRAHAAGRDTRVVLPHEPLDLTGRVATVPAELPLIEHVGYRTVSGSIGKLARYAVNGGVGAATSDEVGPLTGIKLLWGGVVMSGAYKDGVPGIAVASMSALGDYLGLLERWERGGRPPAPLNRGRMLALGAARVAHQVQWRLRRALRRR